MPLASVLAIILVSVALIVAVLHDYRLLVLRRPPKVSAWLISLRIIGVLLVGFGVLGRILDAAGYGGANLTIEVDRRHPLLGNVGSGYEEGPTRLGKLSSSGWLVGLGLLIVSSAVLWSMDHSRRPPSQAGA